MERIAVVGASLAGYWAVESLRRAGHRGEIVFIGDEPHLPYDRPPLSKAVLGEAGPADTSYRDADHFRSLGVRLLLGSPATGLDLDRRRVRVGDLSLGFDGLVITTGTSARRLPFGHDLAGVEVVRTIDDARRVTRALGSTPRVVVIGGGFIGAEVAAAAHGRGCEVTILEADTAPMVRAVGATIGERLGAIHADHGVELRTGAQVVGIGGDSKVESVTLADGSERAADLVVVGIGAVPNTGWLAGSGLEVRDGVVCDASLWAADGVVAAGDVARWEHPLYGEIRIEHWSNAQEQGMKAAQNLVAGRADSTPYDGVPFVWSDQYDHVIQIAGRAVDADEVSVLHEADDRSLVALWRRGDRLAGAVTVDRQRVLTRLRRQMTGDGIGWDDACSFVTEQLA